MSIRSGIDIVQIDRIARALDRHGDFFLTRIFSVEELAELNARPKRSIASIAGRFAAKEATLKVIGRGLWEIPLSEIEILHRPSGRPFARLSGSAAQMARKARLREIDVSISHERHYAIALASALSDALESDCGEQL